MKRLVLLALLILASGCSSSGSRHRRVHVLRPEPAHHHPTRVRHVERRIVATCRDGKHVANCTCFSSAKSKPTVKIRSK